MIKKELTVSIVGDICPVNRVEKIISERDFSSFDDAREVLLKQDLVLANMECPLTQSKQRVNKIGPNLKGDPLTVNLLRYLNVNAVALANNHILDFGREGLSDTVKVLSDNKIEYLGAGSNLSEARKPLLKEINGTRICVMNFCEREFNAASDQNAGANPFDLISVLNEIDIYRRDSDFMILFYHGGIETYNLPSPEMYRNFQFLAGKGIDLIVCNHQHVFSGYQKTQDAHIFYGLGNFIFDWPSIRDKPWNYGLILNLTIRGKELKSFELVPFEQCNENPGIRIRNEIRDLKLKELEVLNSMLSEDVILREWGKFISEKHVELTSDLFIQNRYLRYLLKRTGLLNMLITPGHRRRVHNYFNCLSLSEFARDSLRSKIKS
jgi:poly-gamma-glutamate synthesis protein (capsule biosynthesis protein)